MTGDADRLGAVLRAAGHPVDRVEVTGVASAGATRRTLFVTVHMTDERAIDAVAQISEAVLDVRSATEEGALIDAAESAGVPVPERLAVADRVAGLGDVVISRRVEGLTIPRRILRSLDGRDASQLTADCGQALARLHGVDTESLPPSIPRLDPERRGADYADQQATALDALPVAIPTLRLGLNWLRRHPPYRNPRSALVHGDFRNGNLIVADGRLAGVIDWELAHVGDPMEDVAYLCLRAWRYGNDGLPVGGFGIIDDLRSAYEANGGTWREDAFWWWMVARTVWWGLGLARQADAYLDGRTDSIVLAASGRRVVELEYDLLRLLDRLDG